MMEQSAAPHVTARDFPDCMACQDWEVAGATWPRPCAAHFGPYMSDEIDRLHARVAELEAAGDSLVGCHDYLTGALRRRGEDVADGCGSTDLWHALRAPSQPVGAA